MERLRVLATAPLRGPALERLREIADRGDPDNVDVAAATARGIPVLHDLDALTEALVSGHLGAAALDHFDGEMLPPDHPLTHLDNVVLTPHIGGATYDVETNHTTMIVDGLVGLVHGERPANIVNPEVLP